MPAIITTKLLGYVAGGLGILCLLLVGFGTVQTKRLKASRELTKSLQTQVTTVTGIANERATALEGRDAIIALQSASVQALKDQSDKDRASYKSRVAQAAAQARPAYDKAAQIIQLPAPPADQQCEAARKLILEELTR